MPNCKIYADKLQKYFHVRFETKLYVLGFTNTLVALVVDHKYFCCHCFDRCFHHSHLHDDDQIIFTLQLLLLHCSFPVLQHLFPETTEPVNRSQHRSHASPYLASSRAFAASDFPLGFDVLLTGAVFFALGLLFAGCFCGACKRHG